MKALIQRVSEASVMVEGKVEGRIGKGMLILFCVENGDSEADIELLVRKCIHLRIFDDEQGVMNRTILEAGGEALVISQFTLAASTKKGNRPSYIAAARPEIAVPMYDAFCQLLSAGLGREVQTGIFGADMKVSLVNDGPVTIMLDAQASTGRLLS